MKNYAMLISLSGLLMACSVVPREAYFNRADPEALLDVSSEVVTMHVGQERSVDEITDWIDSDQPTRAELLCASGEPFCNAVEEVLTLYGIDYEYIPSDENALHLIYERVLAHDCEHRFVDNHINPYNLNHPSFGCATASNMVQMVSDRRQFTSPLLLDYYDAEKGTRAYRDIYLSPERESSSDEKYDVEDVSLE